MKLPGYFDVKHPDRSQLEAQIGAQRRRVAQRLQQVRQVVAVVSGKGGVGKSYLTAALAGGLVTRLAGGVGVLDADLRSPTVARLLGAAGPLTVTSDGVKAVPGRAGIKVMSTEFLLDDGQPLAWHEPGSERFVWRGALEAGVLREFLSDVVWGELGLLLIDLPPGADGVVELHELVPRLAGAIVVTLPSDESHRSVRRTARAVVDAGVPLLGVVENMSGYRCPHCARDLPLFSGAAGAMLAAEFATPLWGRVPLVPDGPPAVQSVLENIVERLA